MANIENSEEHLTREKPGSETRYSYSNNGKTSLQQRLRQKEIRKVAEGLIAMAAKRERQLR